MNHELKTWPYIFQAMWEGRKSFDVRRDDRGFKVLDGIVLREYEPKERTYSGRWLSGVVTFLVPGGAWGLPADLCVMQLSLVSRGETEQDPGTLARELWAKWSQDRAEGPLPVPSLYASASTAPAATVSAGQPSPAQVATDAAVEAALEALPSWASAAQQNEAVARATAGLPFVMPESPERALSEARDLLREAKRRMPFEGHAAPGEPCRCWECRAKAWLDGRKP